MIASGAKYTGLYKGIKVSGEWFLLGDSYWLILDDNSFKLIKKHAIPMDEIKSLYTVC